MKFVCIHHRLAGFTSHHFNEAHGLRRELSRRGKELILLISVHAEARIVSALDARPVLDDPTFRMEWSFDERSDRFVKMLHRSVDRLLDAGDCVLLTVSTQLEAHALTRWLEELPRRKKPWIVVLFISDRWNRSGREEYERQIAEFSKLRASIAGLDTQDRHRLIFCTLTDLLAVELTGLLGAKVDVTTVPLEYGNPQSNNSTSRTLPRVAVLGGLRREKGSYLIPDIIRECKSQVPVEFLVQLMNNSLSAEDFAKLSRITEEPNVSVISEAVPLADYENALASADIALFPYEPIPYTKRISGVFSEAAAYGKPAVVTPGTWMADQIESGRAAGTIAEDLQPASIARAIARCVAELEPLQRSAEALSDEWRRSSLSAFVDFVETEIAARARDEQPARRSLWPF